MAVGLMTLRWTLIVFISSSADLCQGWVVPPSTTMSTLSTFSSLMENQANHHRHVTSTMATSQPQAFEPPDQPPKERKGPKKLLQSAVGAVGRGVNRLRIRRNGEISCVYYAFDIN
jgi:hypothetical protein